MASVMLTRLLNYLTGRRSTTATVPNRRVVSYFDEGAGFVFLKALARGADGCAYLVRSLEDNQLYVRKEDLMVKETDERRLPSEIEIANLLQNIPGTVNRHGWFRYVGIDTTKQATMTFCVTYWKFCNSGNLQQCITAYKNSNKSFPEKWACQWFATLLKTMIQLQRNGVAHNDCHTGNLFIHRQNLNADPEIFLGDFGRSVKIDDNASQDQARIWAATANRRDLEQVTLVLRELIQWSSGCDTLREFLVEVEEEIDVYYSFLGTVSDPRTAASVLDTIIEPIAERVEAYARTLPPPASSQDMIIETECGSEGSVPLLSWNGYSKAWKTAILENGEITISWVSPELLKQVQYGCVEGEWYSSGLPAA